MRASTLYSLVFLLLASSAAAAEPTVCLSGFFPQDKQFSLARVTGKKGDKAFFFSSYDHTAATAGCPGQTSCQTKAYVLSGDEILVDNQTMDGWVCAWYPGKKETTVGWLKAGQVEILPAPATPAPADWAGTWRRSDGGFLKIAAADQGKLEVDGKAFWHGGLQGQVEHSGRVHGAAAPAGNGLVVSEEPKDEACTLQLALLGPYLFARDNQRCGGMNVTFQGIYAKAAK